MASVSLMGAVYEDVPAVHLPDANGGISAFYDLSGDTVTSAEHIVSGYVGHLANGTQVTGTGGGEVMPTPIYTLGETSFDGATVIDTGVQLEAVDQDYSIFLDAYTEYNDGQTCLLHCMHEATPWPGMCVDFPKSAMRCIWKSATNSADLKNVGFSDAVRDFRLFITHTAGSGVYKVGVLNRSNAKIIYTEVSNAFASATENLIVGAIQSTSGSKSRYFRGTLYDLRIFDTVLSPGLCYGYLTS